MQLMQFVALVCHSCSRDYGFWSCLPGSLNQAFKHGERYIYQLFPLRALQPTFDEIVQITFSQHIPLVIKSKGSLAAGSWSEEPTYGAQPCEAVLQLHAKASDSSLMQFPPHFHLQSTELAHEQNAYITEGRKLIMHLIRKVGCLHNPLVAAMQASTTSFIK